MIRNPMVFDKASGLKASCFFFRTPAAALFFLDFMLVRPRWDMLVP